MWGSMVELKEDGSIVEAVKIALCSALHATWERFVLYFLSILIEYPANTLSCVFCPKIL